MAPRRSARISSIPNQPKPATSKPQARSSKGSQNNSNPNGITKKRKTPAGSTLKGNVPAKVADTFVLPSTPGSKQPSKDVSKDSLRLTPPPRLDRPVDPHRTNATLMTPRGSSVVVYPSVEDASPSKTGLPRPVTTTGNLLEKALEHLIATDPRLKPVIEKHHCRIFSPEGLAEQVDPFESLISSIISQQVSGAAAQSIKNKFLGLFESTDSIESSQTRGFPTPTEVTQLDIPTLRTAGLSQRKAEYIQGLAEKFASGELSTEKLLRASDEEVMDLLIAVRGLGRWSVEMFSCFALKRTDVFSTGDLGVQRGCAAYVGKDIN
ncbi:DNA glycosylase, partial [Talaromyces proteolyticus]